MSKSLVFLLSAMIVPFCMLGIGFLWIKHPPTSPNWIYGYRTKRSMENQITWDLAQSYQAKIWRWTGGGLLILAIICFMMYGRLAESTLDWFVYLEVAIMLVSLLPTEIVLRRKFDENGKYKKKDS